MTKHLATVWIMITKMLQSLQTENAEIKVIKINQAKFFLTYAFTKVNFLKQKF